MKFETSVPHSIGMELEFQLLDENTLDLVDGILPLMDYYSDHPYITPEFIQNTVEVASKVCYSISELETHFYDVVNELNDRCHSLGMRLCAAGTHPFSQSLAHITPKPRYLKMEAAEAYRSHTQITFATHVHIGMRSGEEAISVMKKLKPYLSLLMGLSANSPFWHGQDTGYASYRHRVLATARSYGMPPSFSSWDEFVHFYHLAKQAGIYESINDIHWDIRPRPKLGTLEVRIMDAQLTIHDAILRAAFLQALVAYLREQPTFNHYHAEYEYEYWLQKDNIYQASRLGMEANNIDHATETVSNLRQVFDSVFYPIVSFFEKAENSDSNIDPNYLYRLREQVEKSKIGYLLQRHIYAESLSLKKISNTLVHQLESDLNQFSNPQKRRAIDLTQTTIL